ncbi:MAG: T9SS type A sorting domain-containing protein [Candidatus Hatepunaea meridiana]|nr:T9SS type A sorting domain-containing protein [Candidatus Hatepunaea meridiana]
MNKVIRLSTLFISIALFIPMSLSAGLLYLTNFHTNLYDEPITLPSGSYYGHIHSNDYLYFECPIDTICGIITSCQDRITFGRGMDLGDLHTRFDPLLNMPPILMPRSAALLRAHARPRISSQNGRYMTRIWLRGNEGIIAYQYELGTEPPSLYSNVDNIINPMRLRPPAWGAIFVEGQVEIYGQLTGCLAIGSSGDMWLVDDIYYTGVDRATGDFIEDRRTPHRLTLISERNIIIKDNWYNGRANGYNRCDPDDTEHHSITITAALLALNESFMIEHTNGDWEVYQGPSPDMRGIIHLRGMIAQWRAGSLCNNNHDGTGYHVDFRYDSRLDYGFPFSILPTVHLIDGIYWDIRVAGFALVINYSECRRITVWPGADIRFLSHHILLVREKLEIQGTEEQPVTVRWQDRYRGGQPASIRTDYTNFSKVDVSYTSFEEGIDLDFNSDSVLINNCTFAGEVSIRGRLVEISNSTFLQGVTLNGWGNIIFDHNLVKGTIIVDGNPRSINIINNTIINPEGDGVFLDSYRSAELNSNIIAYCDRGIVRDNWNDVELRYNAVFGNREGDYINCEPGEGSISLNPRFIDIEEGNYQLSWNSPCIDAGDPDLPLDPDGSRADIGAFYRDRGLTVPEKIVDLPEACSITASPNPFNSSCTISFRVELSSEFQINIYNLSGREIFTDRALSSSSNAKYIIKGSQLGGAGIYFVRLITGNMQETLKIIYLP